jgi:predicted neutral ceramidase superfamily lipid hydrolase
MLRVGVFLFTTFLLSWSLVYTALMGSDYQYFIEYLVLAWTFSGGELPTLMWFASLLLTSLSFIVAYLVKPNLKQRTSLPLGFYKSAFLIFAIFISILIVAFLYLAATSVHLVDNFWGDLVFALIVVPFAILYGKNVYGYLDNLLPGATE